MMRFLQVYLFVRTKKILPKKLFLTMFELSFPLPKIFVLTKITLVVILKKWMWQLDTVEYCFPLQTQFKLPIGQKMANILSIIHQKV